MILLNIFNSVEFYTIATVIAAAIVALCVRPSSRGAAETLFCRGILSYEDGADYPSLDIDVRDDGSVVITRRGLQGLTSDSQVNLAITKIQFDLEIKERIAEIPGYEKVNTATFVLDFMAMERYHLSYTSEQSGLFTSASLTVRPGIHIHRDLNL